MFFDVEVPSLNATLTWSLKTLQESDSGVQTALNTLRNRLDPSDVELRQALQRVAVRVNSSAAPTTAPEPTRTVTPTLPNTRRPAANPGDRQVSAASLAPSAKAAEPDNVLENPNEAYRNEVIKALSDAMLDYSGGLPVNDAEWLTIAARGVYDRPAGNDATTIMVRVRGDDLAAYRARQISREEVLKRIERRVF